jgi:dihydroorotate dehydrogenase
LKIIGVGGIFTAEDAYKKIRLGASLVEIVSGLMYCGPQLAAEIDDGISRFLKRDGFSHISEAVGVDAKKHL